MEGDDNAVNEGKPCKGTGTLTACSAGADGSPELSASVMPTVIDRSLKMSSSDKSKRRKLS